MRRCAVAVQNVKMCPWCVSTTLPSDCQPNRGSYFSRSLFQLSYRDLRWWYFSPSFVARIRGGCCGHSAMPPHPQATAAVPPPHSRCPITNTHIEHGHQCQRRRRGSMSVGEGRTLWTPAIAMALPSLWHRPPAVVRALVVGACVDGCDARACSRIVAIGAAGRGASGADTPPPKRHQPPPWARLSMRRAGRQADGCGAGQGGAEGRGGRAGWWCHRRCEPAIRTTTAAAT